MYVAVGVFEAVSVRVKVNVSEGEREFVLVAVAVAVLVAVRVMVAVFVRVLVGVFVEVFVGPLQLKVHVISSVMSDFLYGSSFTAGLLSITLAISWWLPVGNPRSEISTLLAAFWAVCVTPSTSQ